MTSPLQYQRKFPLCTFFAAKRFVKIFIALVKKFVKNPVFDAFRQRDEKSNNFILKDLLNNILDAFLHLQFDIPQGQIILMSFTFAFLKTSQFQNDCETLWYTVENMFKKWLKIGISQTKCN